MPPVYTANCLPITPPPTPRIRIAILPFEPAEPSFDTAAQAVTQELVTVLMGTGLFEVVEPGLVYDAMAETGTRNLYGLDSATMEELQQTIGAVRVFMVGTISDYGDVRIGPESYPSITLNARVLDAQTARIIWSGSVSRSGADTEKLFGLGAIHSQGRLARSAVMGLLRKTDQKKLAALLVDMDPNAFTQIAAPQPGGDTSPTRGPTGDELYMDESATHTEAALVGFLADTDGFVRGDVTYRQHHYDIVEATYTKGDDSIQVKLVDYRELLAAQGFVEYDHPDEAVGDLDGLAAYAGTSAHAPGQAYLDVQVGRFGLFISGPQTIRADMESVARAMIDAMK